MRADEIAEAVLKLQSDGKIIDFGLSNFTTSQTELIRQTTTVLFNQVQFSALILNRWLMEVLIICKPMAFVRCPGIR
jgi:predicted oxidoreductase